MASITTNNETQFSLPAIGGADWLIRLSLAGTMLFHGIDKFPNIAAGAEMMGFPYVIWLLVALGEIAAGAGILIGGVIRTPIGDLITRVAGVITAIILVGAIYFAHWGQWSNVPSETHPFGGMEFQTMLVAVGLFFALRGNRA